MDEPWVVAYVLFVFLFTGTIKGMVGIGLASISLGLMVVVLDLPHAIALMLFPAFISNFWQALYGGNAMFLLKRIWPFLLVGNFTLFIGAMALTRVDLNYLSALLGFLLFVYALISLTKFRVKIPERRDLFWGVLLGAINGVVTGMTGTYVVPGVMYLQGIGLTRDQLIQAMGMLFFSLTVTMAIALQGNNLWSYELGVLSVVSVVPALIGMYVGQKIRRRLSEELFRKVFLISLLLLGIYVVFNAMLMG